MLQSTRSKRKIPHPLASTSEFDFYTTKRRPQSDGTFSESSRRDSSNAAIFSLVTVVFAAQYSSFKNQSGGRPHHAVNEQYTRDDQDICIHNRNFPTSLRRSED